MFHASIKHIGDKQYITDNLIFGNENPRMQNWRRNLFSDLALVIPRAFAVFFLFINTNKT
jgi:hypothetical protein